ncbi:hypothetical protein DDI_2443 [Dickeya dianthicola RNS04.9]|nr:hypothetical protein DDI_2443 [Dickeya dianthicola RNS04.9]
MIYCGMESEKTNKKSALGGVERKTIASSRRFLAQVNSLSPDDGR